MKTINVSSAVAMRSHRSEPLISSGTMNSVFLSALKLIILEKLAIDILHFFIILRHFFPVDFIKSNILLLLAISASKITPNRFAIWACFLQRPSVGTEPFRPVQSNKPDIDTRRLIIFKSNVIAGES
ncbi:MAG: hypothetical protein PHP23_01555 [Desulfobacterales bacterium]|nr:hypothetical protein [Desulfobacterales bacterium]MDD4071360.1 hypothetical protein [Desulfobacterales bacterium]MDD4392668.1 hypothetical protein [Desulfobacterales bacterium]